VCALKKAAHPAQTIVVTTLTMESIEARRKAELRARLCRAFASAEGGPPLVPRFCSARASTCSMVTITPAKTPRAADGRIDGADPKLPASPHERRRRPEAGRRGLGGSTPRARRLSALRTAAHFRRREAPRHVPDRSARGCAAPPT